MPHQEVGKIGVFLLRAAAQRVHIVHHVLPAVVRAEVERFGVLLCGETVAEVVVRDHDKAVLCQKFGEGRVSHPVLRHTVRDLQDSDGRAVGRPFRRVDAGNTVGRGKVKFLAICHGAKPSCMI